MDTKAQSLIVSSPTEYFRERITTASDNLKISLDQEMEFYLVKLLCDFINPEKIKTLLPNSETNALEVPLVFILQRAYETHSPEEKMQLLRNLGDVSLYVAGFFQDYFNRKTFDISYYIEMGSLAYSNVAELAKERHVPRSTTEIYSELSSNFSLFVDVVAEAASQDQELANKDVLAIYDRWTRCNSDRLRKILTQLGIHPVPNIPIKIAQ